MAAAGENDQKLIDDFLLADDHLAELGANVRCQAGKIFHLEFLLEGAVLESEKDFIVFKRLHNF